MKYCMGIKTKHPKSSMCQKCEHLVRTVLDENTCKNWVENPCWPCDEFKERIAEPKD